MTYQVEQRALRLLETKMRQLYPKGRLLPASIAKFTVARDPKTRGAQVSFNVTTLTGIGSIALLRNTARDPGTAKQLHLWTRQMLKRTPQTFPFPCTYGDADQAIVGQTVYYWLRIQPANDLWNAQTVGPLVLDNTANAGAPGALLAFDLSHQGAGANGTVLISGSFQAASDGKTQSVKIYVAGYQGVAAKVAIAQIERSPFNFSLAMTGEAVTFTAVAVSSEGAESAGVTKALTLNGVATVPAEVVGVSVLELTTGIQLSWLAGDANEGVTEFTIYRGPRGGGFGAAALLTTVAWSGATTYVYLDAAGRAASGPYEYYILATNPAGNSAAPPAAAVSIAQSLAIGDLLPRGSTPVTFSGAFTYTSNTNSITWSWSSLVVYYPDGSTVNVTNGSQQITGLSASTTYYFYPYWDEPTQTVQWVAIGGLGNPGIAYTARPYQLAQHQSLISRVPLSSGAMSAATTSSGGGSGGGGGSSSCFSGNTLIRTPLGNVAIQNIVPGDLVFSVAGRQRVRRIISAHRTGVMLDMGAGELVTPGHFLRSNDGHWLQAHCFFDHFVPFEGTVYNLELEGDGSDDQHCYLLGNGRWAHNYIFQS